GRNACAGVLPRAMHDLFERIGARSDTFAFDIEVQYVQLYRDAWFDLLAGTGVGSLPAGAAGSGVHEHGRRPAAAHSAGGRIANPAAASRHAAGNVREVLLLLQ